MPLATFPEILRVSDGAALCEAAASIFMRAADDAVRASGRFTVALAGGSTPRGLYTLLATDATLRSGIAWNTVHVFWGDERHVPPDHPDSNFRMANEALLTRVPVEPSHVWRIRGEYPDTSKAADEYERNLRVVFGRRAGQLPRFDLVLLGMGEDGHTASLFPGTTALRERQRLVIAQWVPKLHTDRITLTAPVLNNAACVMFLVQGVEKARALKAVLEDPFEPERLPAQLISPNDGRLLWIVDRSAASLLAPSNAT
jgi:6-phosphogluconolactonase